MGVGDFIRSLRAELTPGCPVPPNTPDCNPFAPACAVAPDIMPDPIEEARQRKRDAVRAVCDALTELNVANRRLREAEAARRMFEGCFVDAPPGMMTGMP